MFNFNVRQWGLTWIIGFTLVCMGFFFGVRHEQNLEKARQVKSQLSEAKLAIAKMASAATALTLAQDKFTKGVIYDKDQISSAISSIHTGALRLSVPTKSSQKL